jgi:hypothetical protein
MSLPPGHKAPSDKSGGGDQRLSPPRAAVVQFDPRSASKPKSMLPPTPGKNPPRRANRCAPELATWATASVRVRGFCACRKVPAGRTANVGGFHCKHGATSSAAFRPDWPQLDTAVLGGPGALLGSIGRLTLNQGSILHTRNLGFPVFETKIEIGPLCAGTSGFRDRGLVAQQGADFICVPIGRSLDSSARDAGGICMPAYLTMAAAHLNNALCLPTGRAGARGRFPGNSSSPGRMDGPRDASPPGL